jgi:hypothetical protein
MANPIPQPAANSPVPGTAGSPAGLSGVATAAAGRNPPKTPPKPAGPVNKGGRRSTEEESRAWLASKGLRAVAAADAPSAPLVAEPPPPLDPAFVKQSAGALVDGYSDARRDWVASALSSMGLPKETADKVLAMAAIKPGNRNTVVECSPAVLESLGVDSRKFPLAVVVIASLFDSLQFMSCLAMLKRLRSEQKPPPPPPAKQLAPNATSAPAP